MTCVWDSVFASLTAEDYSRAGLPRPANRELLAQMLRAQRGTAKLSEVRWQGEELSAKFVEECREYTQFFTVQTPFIELDRTQCVARGGYLLSSCDPLLIYVCAVLDVNIVHRFGGTTYRGSEGVVRVPRAEMRYEIDGAVRTLTFRSSDSHFRR